MFDPMVCIITFVISFMGFFVKGVAAFGDPLITTPLLSMFYDNHIISPSNLCFNVPINGYIAWKNRHAFSITKILPVLCFILLGVIPGTLLMQYATSWILKAGLGVIIIGIGLEMLTRDRAKAIAYNRYVMAITSFCSGVTAGLYGINLFFVSYIERTTSNRNEFRGNICFVFFIENVFRLAVYLTRGVFTMNVLHLTLIALPGMLLGFFTGSRIDKKLSEKTIRLIVIIMFMLGGLSILIKALIWKS